MVYNYTALLRPNAAAAASTTADPKDPQASDWLESTRKKYHDFTRREFMLTCPINIPSTPEAAALRIVKNLSHFALYYAHFIWIILLITLIPERKVSLVYFVIMTYVASLFLLLLKALPSGWFIQRNDSKAFVLGLIGLVTMIMLILTKAGLHMVLTLVGSVPVVLVHAVLWVREDLCVVHGEEDTLLGGDGQTGPLSHEATDTV